MFNFDFNWDWSGLTAANISKSLAETPVPAFDDKWLAQVEKEIAAVASVATTTALNSPAVVDAPANVAPSAPAVQKVVEDTVKAVAPVVAPNIPANVLSDFGKFIAKEVVASPEVKKSDVGEVPPIEVFTDIVQNALDAATEDKKFVSTVTNTVATQQKEALDKFNQGLQLDDFEASLVGALPPTPETPAPTAAPTPTPTPTLAPAVTPPPLQPKISTTEDKIPKETPPPYLPPTTTTPKTPDAPYYDINKGMMVNPDGTPYVAPKGAVGPAGGVTTAEDTGLKFGAGAPGAITGTGTTAVTPDQAAINAGLVFGAGAPGVITGGGATPTEPQPSVTEYIRTQLGGGGTQPVGAGTQLVGAGTQPIGAGTQPIGGIGTQPAQPGRTYTASDGTQFTDVDAFVEYEKLLEGKRTIGQSAYSLLFSEFERYGLGKLVEPLRNFISQGLSSSEFTMKLRETDAYKKRFAANQQRISKGLRALSEAEYIGLEDQYQDIMRRYGLPETYYTRGDMGRQEGFEKFIAGDVSPVELEDRISTAQNRIIYANPEVGIALKTFYPDITNGDILAYALDPDKALAQIKRRITAAEVGSTAVQMGLATNVTDAEYLARYGVTKEQAQRGYQTIAGGLPRGTFLSEIYGKQGMGPYTQATAEQEVFAVPGAAEAERKRRRLTQLETAEFAGQTGVTGGALARERAGGF